MNACFSFLFFYLFVFWSSSKERGNSSKNRGARSGSVRWNYLIAAAALSNFSLRCVSRDIAAEDVCVNLREKSFSFFFFFFFSRVNSFLPPLLHWFGGWEHFWAQHLVAMESPIKEGNTSRIKLYVCALESRWKEAPCPGPAAPVPGR